MISRNIILGSLLMALIADPASAAKRYRTTQWADVQINAQGQLEQLQWVDPALGPDVTAHLEDYVRQLPFKPAVRDGKPVPARTSLRLELTVDRGETPNEPSAMTLTEVHPMARPLRLRAPVYPRDQLDRGRTAVVNVKLQFDATGKVLQASALNDAQLHRSFVDASLKAARFWRVIPEQVDGSPIGGEVVYPILYVMDSPQVRRRTTLQLPGGQPLPMTDHPDVFLRRESAVGMGDVSALPKPRFEFGGA